MCKPCRDSHGHEHLLVEEPFNRDVQPYLIECEEAVLKALQSVEPQAKSLEECARSTNAGCAKQAETVLMKLSFFARPPQK